VVAGVPKKYVSIDIPEETYNKLVEAKKKLGARTWAEFFDQLLKKHDACVEYEREMLVKKVVCNDLRQARASPAGWARLFANKLGDPFLMEKAFEYLRPDPSNPGDYIVDLDKCIEAGSKEQA
jgi:predicted CopG family antitoxin